MRNGRPVSNPPFVNTNIHLNSEKWIAQLMKYMLCRESLSIFKEHYFQPQLPIVLPRSQFGDLPAISRWFKATKFGPHNTQILNYEYLGRYGDCHVPLELTTCSTGGVRQESFKRFHAPLNLFLEWVRSSQNAGSTYASDDERAAMPNYRLYLAQCQLLDLAEALRDDLPAPSYVTDPGKGDIYDTNIWMGIAPTYTPLHRDPNPNIFVQLAGSKSVRLVPPSAGLAVFDRVRAQIGKGGGYQNAAFRGDEMMYGREKELLDQEIWACPTIQSQDQHSLPIQNENETGEAFGYEAVVNAGDGIFIPKGWWHSIKGVGDGITASVNWWFR